MSLSRRRFLARMGWTAVGTTVLASTGCSLLPALPSRGSSSDNDAATWIQLTPDGRFRLFEPRAEIGQDASTGLAQVAADALEIDLSRIDLVRADTDAMAPVRSTVGSESILLFAPLVAGAANALREALTQRAAMQLEVDAAALSVTADGFTTPAGKTITFSELAPDEGELLVLEGFDPAQVTLRKGNAVGAPVAARDLPAIVTAQPLYAGDVRLPGMLHGRVLRAPGTAAGSSILELDDGRARALPGCRGVVRPTAVRDSATTELAVLIGDRAGVLDRAEQLISIDWSQGDVLDVARMERELDVNTRLAAGKLEHELADDDVAPASESDPWTVDLSLEVPFAAHGFLEPRCAVAAWEGERLQVWTGTQDAYYVRAHLARTLGMDEADIRVQPMRTGGGFGGRTLCTVELEAARASRAAGHPVRIQWTRSDEFRFGFHRPPSHHRLRARLDASGRISDWWHAFTSGHVIFSSAAMPPWMQSATSLVPDPGVGRGAVPPYQAARTRVEFTDVRLPVPTGPWRGLGAAPNGCAVEILTDALARAAGQDPVQFRLAHLKPEQARTRVCLERLAAMTAGVQPAPGHALGFACASYKEASYVAVAAEVTRGTSDARVTRLWCAHDCGLVVNPDRVRAQIEGNLVWAIGTVLQEELTFDGDGPSARQFDRYALPRFSQVPPMQIALIDSGAPPSGAAETAIAAAPAAIANAFGALDGAPPTRLPLG